MRLAVLALVAVAACSSPPPPSADAGTPRAAAPAPAIDAGVHPGRDGGVAAAPAGYHAPPAEIDIDVNRCRAGDGKINYGRWKTFLVPTRAARALGFDENGDCVIELYAEHARHFVHSFCRVPKKLDKVHFKLTERDVEYSLDESLCEESGRWKTFAEMAMALTGTDAASPDLGE